MFPFIGLPSIIQSDNGREFVHKLNEEGVVSWPGSVQLVSGRPRHPQSQGLVEQAHYTLERMFKLQNVDPSHLPGQDGCPTLSVSWNIYQTIC